MIAEIFLAFTIVVQFQMGVYYLFALKTHYYEKNVKDADPRPRNAKGDLL